MHEENSLLRCRSAHKAFFQRAKRRFGHNDYREGEQYYITNFIPLWLFSFFQLFQFDASFPKPLTSSECHFPNSSRQYHTIRF